MADLTNAPALDMSGFANPYDYYKQAASNMMPSPESLDRSAARLRSSNDQQYNANAQRIGDQFAGKGRSNSGAYDYAQTMNNYGRQQAYSTGYTNLLDDYEKNRMTGAQNLGNMASNYGNTLNQQGNLQLGAQQNQISQQTADTGRYNAQTTRSTETAKALNDFLTMMGGFGNVHGDGSESGNLFDRIFASGRLGMMNLLGMPTGTSEQPGFSSGSQR